MSDFRVTFDGGRVVARLINSDEVFAAETSQAVRRASLEGESRSKQVIQSADRIDLGALLGSVQAEPVSRTGQNVVGGWGTNAEHAEVIEKGRRPGRPMPPRGVLLPWMARHGIPAEAEFTVRRKIGLSGIPGIFFMRTARDQVEPLFRAEMRQAVARALRRIGGG